MLSGALTTANGTRPLSHVPLVVTWRNDGYIVSGSVRKKAVTQTDEAGNYELRFLIRDDEFVEGYFVVEPALDVTKYVYCRYEGLDFDFFDLKRDTTLLANYDIPEKAFIEFALSNPGALQTGDKLTTQFSYSFGKDGQEICSSSIQWNEFSNSSHVVEVAADQPLLLEQVKLKNGVESKEQITLELKAGETKVLATDF